LEVKIITGQSKQDFRTKKELKYDILFLTPEIKDRECLYTNINTRVWMMFDEWLIEEVKNLRKIYSDETPGLKTIGYIEIVSYLKWEISLEECIWLVQQHNRNYAKRQYTWFRRYNEFIK
jgi:tRNA dimethylallyltransferase